MKKLTIIIFSLLFSCLIFYKFQPEKRYKVLRIVTADEIIIDFNHNNKEDSNETVKIYGIKPFTPKLGRETTFRANSIGTDKAKIVALGEKTDIFAKTVLENKFVTLKFISDERKEEKHFSNAIIYINNKDYGKILLEKGYALADFKNDLGYKNNENILAIDNNIKGLKTDNLVVLNKKNNKYHRLNCKFAQKAKNYTIIDIENAPKDAIKCS